MTGMANVAVKAQIPYIRAYVICRHITGRGRMRTRPIRQPREPIFNSK